MRAKGRNGEGVRSLELIGEMRLRGSAKDCKLYLEGCGR